MISIEFRNNKPVLVSDNPVIQRGLNALKLDGDRKRNLWSCVHRYNNSELIAAVRSDIEEDPRIQRVEKTERWTSYLLVWIAHGWRVELRIDFSNDGLMDIEPSLHR